MKITAHGYDDCNCSTSNQLGENISHIVRIDNRQWGTNKKNRWLFLFLLVATCKREREQCVELCMCRSRASVCLSLSVLCFLVLCFSKWCRSTRRTKDSVTLGHAAGEKENERTVRRKKSHKVETTRKRDRGKNCALARMQIERTPKHVKARRRKETGGNTTSVRTGHTPHLYGDIASLSLSSVSLSRALSVSTINCLISQMLSDWRQKKWLWSPSSFLPLSLSLFDIDNLL